MATPYSKLTTSGLSAIASTTLGALKPYQLNQVIELLGRVNWGRANSNSGMGSAADVGAQPTIAQIITALGVNNP